MLNALRTDNSPFSEQQISALRQGLGQLDRAQTAWLSGYLAGKLTAEQTIESPAVLPSPARSELRVFYASQTGNGETIAEQLAQQAIQAGLPARAQSLNDLRPAALKKVERAAFIISTHGEGDPPDDALDLFEFLESTRAPRLDALKFRILALGDRTYSEFCAAGHKLERLLLARGAQVFAQRVDCDLDYEAAAVQWSSEVIEYGCQTISRPGESTALTPPGKLTGPLNVVPITSRWSRKQPFPATVEKVQKITTAASNKEVFHMELSIKNSGLRYEPGDSLGVWAFNDKKVVAGILDQLNIDPQAEVKADDRMISIAELLLKHRELTRLSPDMLAALATLAPQPGLQQRLARFTTDEKRNFIEHRQFIDIVTEFPLGLEAQELADLLRPLSPRSYSIASSQASVDEEVHLTVATLRSNGIGVERRGVASHYLNRHLQAGDEVGVFLEPNNRFRLPADRSTPLILIAAGTGIAPYRAFLQQLEEEGVDPDTWLIFGNQQLRTDFLYQREWLNWRSKGLLSRIDCAFSRDQAEKHYVQHVITGCAAELVGWLDRGAHFYICGAQAMGREVELALQQAIGRQRGINAEAAAAVISNLRRERRLLKDLY